MKKLGNWLMTSTRQGRRVSKAKKKEMEPKEGVERSLDVSATDTEELVMWQKTIV